MTTTMEVSEILEHIKPLTKKQKAEVVKQTVAMMAGKDPVFIALERWSKVYLDLKHCRYGGVRYMPADYRGMKNLLQVLRTRLGDDATDDQLLDGLEALMRVTAALPNPWYYQNRFTPAGLASDFEKIYSLANQKRHDNNGKNAFDYL